VPPPVPTAPPFPDSTPSGAPGPPRVGGAPKDRVVLDAVRAPLHPQARETLLAALDAGWADPRRLHQEGRRARRLLDQAREVLSCGLGVRPDELSFHLIGADALATGLAGLRHPRRRGGECLVASAVELEILLTDPAAHTVAVDAHGRVDLSAFTEAVAEPGVAVAALQHANGEVGTLQPVEEALVGARAAGVPLLVDATASLGRVPVPTAFDALAGDAASFSGPPLGLLAVRPGATFALPGPVREAEQGRALSAPWVPLTLAAAEAWQQVAATRDADEALTRELVVRLRAGAVAIAGVTTPGEPSARLPHVLTLVVEGLDGELLADELDRRGIAVASGSACSASPLHPSHVLAAMGIPLPGRQRPGNLRVVLPVPAAAPGLVDGVERLVRELGPAVEAVRERLAQVVRPG
jgi:cysteine desulfurase